MANAHDFIGINLKECNVLIKILESLPQGYQTRIGEGKGLIDF